MKLLLTLTLIFFSCSALAIETAAKQAIIMDDATGTILFAKEADSKMHPSSMSKLMTVYIVFKHLKDGSLKLTDTLPVSKKAWATQGSKTFVEIGAKIAVSDLIQGIIIQSGNDACVVVAEGIAGSEEAFAEQMNDMARELGLENSHFTNANGLPDDNHLMTARDLAILSHRLIHDFPEYYHYFSQKEFVYHGIKQGNRNMLLYGDDSGVDGLKTGHTDGGGFGMAVSGKDKTGRRVIVVVNGLTSMNERAEEAQRLLSYAFQSFENVTLLHADQEIDKADVWFGTKPQVGLTVDHDTTLTLPRGERSKLQFTVNYKGPLQSPVNKGDHVADLTIAFPHLPTQSIPLIAAESVGEVHGIDKILRTLHYYISGK